MRRKNIKDKAERQKKSFFKGRDSSIRSRGNAVDLRSPV